MNSGVLFWPCTMITGDCGKRGKLLSSFHRANPGVISFSGIIDEGHVNRILFSNDFVSG